MNANDYKISINVVPAYIPDQSQPDKHSYVFSYTVTIVNEGVVPARLLTRHWIITDANGGTQEVRGDGVVGEQPYLKRAKAFSTSAAP